jgi:DNA ligase-1
LQKTALVQERFTTLDPLAACYLVKILTGDLRIGLKEGLVEEAIAAAFEAKLEEIREANMLLGDIGETALLAQRRALSEASLRLFRPVKCMLASPEPDAEAVWKRLQESQKANGEAPESGRRASWIEDKYDGMRAQIHIGDGRVEIYSRDLRKVTEQFADLARAARSFAGRIILDGELLAYDPERRLTFFDLQKRLGRKTEDDLFLGRNDVPVAFRAFDLLFLDGEAWLRKPLAERRESLERVALPAGLEAAPITLVNSAEDVERAFAAARARGNEGLIAKDGASLYTPGRRGLAWVKLKKELATLDVVVVGAELGHGKRSGVLSDYTFAVRDDDTGSFLTIGKAYSGVTDEEIDELTEHFRSTTTAVYGKYREVRPEVVFEIAFDSVQISDRHNSGLALRFPRIKAIRRDKTPADIDSLSYARSLVDCTGQKRAS